jgi:hypothetical protein
VPELEKGKRRSLHLVAFWLGERNKRVGAGECTTSLKALISIWLISSEFSQCTHYTVQYVCAKVTNY